MARREIKHANVRVVGLWVALLLRGEKYLDKEMDISDVRSDNSGPAQAQPIRGVL